MNNTQKQFIDILSSGIRGKNVDKSYENVEWEQIINLAIENKVEGIVYSSLHKSSLVSVVGEKRINLLKQKAEDAEIEQLRKISELSVVIKKINKENPFFNTITNYKNIYYYLGSIRALIKSNEIFRASSTSIPHSLNLFGCVHSSSNFIRLFKYTPIAFDRP